jgi:hypothetical protein
MRCTRLLAVTVFAFASLLVAQEIPAGTVVPIMLTNTVDSGKAHPGDAILGKVMETVPLPDGARIPQGAKVIAHVDQVMPAKGKDPSWIAIEFDHVIVQGREVPVKASLRAVASMMAVYDAQVPFFEPDTTPRSAVMLAPVGGDPAFRPDNPEKSYKKLVQFSGELPPGCGGRVDQEGTTGALWVFSPYACGVYGFGKGLAVVKDGVSEPVGNIILGSQKNFQLHAGMGWLLRMQSRESSAFASSQ